MKPVLLFILLLLTACSPSLKLDDIYFSDKQDCFYLDGKKGLIETKKENIIDELTLKQTSHKIKFRKGYFSSIFFHSSRCFGFCDDLRLSLDHSGNLKVTNNGNGRSDSGVNRNYYGKISYEDRQLVSFLYRLICFPLSAW